MLRIAQTFCALAYAVGSGLPSVHHEASNKEAVLSTKKWWFRVDDQVYHTPQSSSLLSMDVKDYYMARGAPEALTPALRERRVAGSGTLHIFHLPEGPAFMNHLKEPTHRREGFSRLLQVEASSSHEANYPAYELNEDYKNPLKEEGMKIEKEMVEAMGREPLMDYLRKLVALETRSAFNNTATKAAVKLLSDTLTGFGLPVCTTSSKIMLELEDEEERDEEGVDDKRIHMKNVVAMIPGTEEGKSITIGAHYDSRPYKGYAPGAVDNGSGVAGVLLAAELFAKHKIRPKRTIYFTLFGAEEEGLFGSIDFVKRLTNKGLPKRCKKQMESKKGSFLEKRLAKSDAENEGRGNDHISIILDEIAWRSPNHEPAVTLEAYEWARSLTEHMAQSSKLHNPELEVKFNREPFSSDHMSWLKKGYQSVLAIQAWDDHYKGYHTSRDTIEKVNEELFEQIMKMNTAALLRASFE